MGSVAKRPDGKWRARYRDAEGQEHSKHFRRKHEAEKWVAAQTTDLQRGEYIDPKAGEITLRDWYAQWRDVQVWAVGTYAKSNQAIDSCDFAGMKIKDVRPSHVQAWVKRMDTPDAAGKKLSPGTIKNRVKMIRSAFKAACQDAVILRDPTEKVKLPRERKAEAKMLLLTSEQVREAMDSAPPEFSAFIAVCAFAGLRLGEAAGLQVGDVDFLRGTITVARQVQGAGTTSLRIEPPKHGSERVVFVPRRLTDLLSQHIVEQGVRGEAQWLFGRGEHVYNWNSAGFIWRNTRAKAGLPEAAHIHDLRHYFASGLIASGCDVVTVQRALGHSSPSITLDIYSHLWPTAEDKTRAAANGLMAAALGDSADQMRTNRPASQ
ncbi:site-specific integrase [Galactobacter sp.]|uniref:tyrosine-type recombinase/integrase n=1 Tax=Galactobacter sp. TaxID=2676125 RepID=UPI0025BF4B9B|nr:site-specific integrase [Galactobacter sp.]